LFFSLDSTKELYLIVYVDDIKTFALITKLIEKLVIYLKSKYEITNMSEIKFYLDKKINRSFNENEIYLSQIKYIKDLLERHEITNCAFVSISMFEIKLTKTLDNHKSSNLKDYQILLKKLMYLMIQTKSNIAYFISRLAQFMINFTVDH
jgi:hypothetical protein